MVIVGVLVCDNWVGVGKKELVSDLIMGMLGKLLDGVFIDCDDLVVVVEILYMVEECVCNGLLIVIVFEGIRLDIIEVGLFKKGFFCIVMVVKILIVLIVICNVEIVVLCNFIMINLGMVDVVVFLLILVDDWILDVLLDCIVEVC